LINLTGTKIVADLYKRRTPLEQDPWFINITHQINHVYLAKSQDLQLRVYSRERHKSCDDSKRDLQLGLQRHFAVTMVAQCQHLLCNVAKSHGITS